MKLKDLKTGMRIILRNGQEYIVLNNVITPYERKEDMYILVDGGWMSSSSYNDDLTCKGDSKEYDIMKVYAQNNGNYLDGDVLQRNAIKNMDLIWERKEKRKMTVAQICKELGYDIEIIKED